MTEQDQRTTRSPDALRVTAIIATWNRLSELRRCIAAVTQQEAVGVRLEVVVVDNASSDETFETLADENPGATLIKNTNPSGLRPRFQEVRGKDSSLQGGTLTLIQNRQNLGGTGAFNTGLSYLWLNQHQSPDFVWLVDDDAVVSRVALGSMLSATHTDSNIGLVGSRTVSLDDSNKTLESTIFFDPESGFMRDHPPEGHRMHDAFHSQGIADATEGTFEVDVASACSMLVRWEAAREVGPWDEAFFLYCDDADWCLRHRARGWRVVNCLDSTVAHAPWHEKLTPERDYYAKRNAFWMHQRSLRGARRRFLTLRWSARLLRESVRRWRRGESATAWMTARAVLDALLNRGGPLRDAGRGSTPSSLAFWSTVIVAAGIAGVVWPWKRKRRSPRWADTSS